MFPSITDNAYAAGIIDGEGHIRISTTSSKTGSLVIEAGGTDPRLCVWLKAHYQGSFRICPRKSPRITYYHWQVASATAANFLKAIYPYLVIKRDQADIALAFLETIQPMGQGKLFCRTKDKRLKLKAQLELTRKIQPLLN